MNYIKIIAGNEHFNIRLFVKEKDCYLVLKTIRDIHLSLPTTCTIHRYSGRWEGTPLSVNIRRVRVDSQKTRKYRRANEKLAAIVDNSFARLNELKESYKTAA